MAAKRRSVVPALLAERATGEVNLAGLLLVRGRATATTVTSRRAVMVHQELPVHRREVNRAGLPLAQAQMRSGSHTGAQRHLGATAPDSEAEVEGALALTLLGRLHRAAGQDDPALGTSGRPRRSGLSA